MNVYDEYGFESTDVLACSHSLERALGIRLEEHTSSYRGKYYSGNGKGGETLLVQSNFVEESNEGWTFEEHKMNGVLLFASNLSDADEFRMIIEHQIPIIRLLYRKVIDDHGELSLFKPAGDGFQRLDRIG